MPTLLERARAAHDQAVERLHTLSRTLDDPPDDADIDALTGDADDAVADVERTRAELTRAETLDRARHQNPAPDRSTDQRVDVVDDAAELTYRPGDRTRSFFADMYAQRYLGDAEAGQRLTRNAQEQRAILRDRGVQLRDVTTGAFGALIPPQYLVDMYAPIMRAGRPFAEAVRRLPLPDEGMVLNIPRGTTGTAVAIQASENSAIQETDFDETTLAVNVRTIAGMQDISRQALERGSGVDEIIFADLAAAYATELDNQILNGAGTSGTHLGTLSTSGINTVTYTDATPTVAEVWPKLQAAQNEVASGRFMAATAWVMHPRRWAWFNAAVDSTGRPLIPPSDPMNPMGRRDEAPLPGFVGSLAGLPVLVDSNVPTNLGAGTNEDIILCVRLDDLLLWEDGAGQPMQMRFDEPLANTLTVRLVAYGYSAFSAGRYPEAVATLGGTGLVAPTF